MTWRTRFPPALACACLAAPLPGQPARTDVDVTYDCSERRETAEGVFTAAPERVGWSYDLGGGFVLGGALALIGEAQTADFSRAGVAGGNFPLFLEFPLGHRDLGMRNHGEGRGWHNEVFAEFRIGRKVYRLPSSINVAGVLPWQAVQQMASEPGDLVITLYRRASLPRRILDALEPQLREMHAAALLRQKDQGQQCRREVIDHAGDIIVT